jgi:hypothetical protein
MIRREIGATGITVPLVSMGAMNADNPEIVRASFENGVRHFDTASLYAFGRNEQMLGKVINDLGVRDQVVIGTKERLGNRSGLNEDQTRDKFINLAEGSLKRLGTDYVDIIYYHSAESVEDAKDQGILAAFDRLKKDGKARAAGFSTHRNMAEIIDYVAEHNVCDVVLSSINVSMADDAALSAAMKKAAKTGVGLIAMKTQAGGRQLPNQAVFEDYENGVIHSAMLKWVLRHQEIATAVPGYTSYQHMKEDLVAAYGLEYTEDEKRFLADSQLQVGLGFCRQCRTCMASCGREADIPALMRTHMYAAQYSNFRQARAALEEIPSGRGIEICRSCDACRAVCSHGVDIPYRIADLKQILG